MLEQTPIRYNDYLFIELKMKILGKIVATSNLYYTKTLM